MKSSLLLLINISILWLRVNTEVYSAMSEMNLLLKTQDSVIKDLDDFVFRKKTKNKTIKRHLARFVKEHLSAMEDIPRYLENPINSFRLIKRLTVDLEFIKKVINSIADFEWNKDATYPTKEDLEGAADAVLRVRTMYHLNMSDISDGLWRTNYSKDGKVYYEEFNPMTVSDCVELGKALYKVKSYEEGISWMRQAHRKISDLTLVDDNRYSEDDIEQQIRFGFEFMDNVVRSFVKWYQAIKVIRPDVDSINPDYILHYFTKGMTVKETINIIQVLEPLKKKPDPTAEDRPEKINTASNFVKYAALCRGERTNPNYTTLRLSCHYAMGSHPFLKLARIKVERLHYRPDVLLFYDVLSDAEIYKIQNISKPKLNRSIVYFPSTNKASTYRDRICKAVALKSNETVIKNLNRRISVVTGLCLDESEPMQVFNYGLGGHFAPHYDFFTGDNYTDESGNRIATILFFLSEVEQGGATVFIKLGITVYPIKGAALYWSNLLPSGYGDPSTLHAACPVLRGSKWALSQWINVRGQELHRPCVTNRRRKKTATIDSDTFSNSSL